MKLPDFEDCCFSYSCFYLDLKRYDRSYAGGGGGYVVVVEEVVGWWGGGREESSLKCLSEGFGCRLGGS